MAAVRRPRCTTVLAAAMTESILSDKIVRIERAINGPRLWQRSLLFSRSACCLAILSPRHAIAGCALPHVFLQRCDLTLKPGEVVFPFLVLRRKLQQKRDDSLAFFKRLS